MRVTIVTPKSREKISAIEVGLGRFRAFAKWWRRRKCIEIYDEFREAETGDWFGR